MIADIRVHSSSFGGGWAFARTAKGREALENKFFGEEAAPLQPFGGDEGWIIEPYDVDDLCSFVKEEGLTIG